jgi:hypothetical protein
MVEAGESEYTGALKTRKLLIFRDAQNAENGKIALNWNVSGTRDFLPHGAVLQGNKRNRGARARLPIRLHAPFCSRIHKVFSLETKHFSTFEPQSSDGSLRTLRSEYTGPPREVYHGQALSPSGDSTVENPANTKK